MFNFFRRPSKSSVTGLIDSYLFNDKTFYSAFMDDLKKCKEEVIIESPFITSTRGMKFVPVFKELINKGVKIHIITRDAYEGHMNSITEGVIETFEEIGIDVLLSSNHHRKIAILDRKILWEGSLNILSQSFSREIMRRIPGEDLAMQMFNFLELNSII